MTTQKQFRPNYFELKHGFYENGVFHCPAFAIFRNGERMVLGGVIKVSYPYSQAHHILMHLQEVSNDTFTLEPTTWQAMKDYEIVYYEEAVA